ncbi:MAG: YbaB/EbfC family nucleoid-associated protein [Rickettsiales bacterium]|nr:YbaB/EbfC family nucleoid-associated protein [Rickettsiales bacterium]|tara:strand:+ start:500 stop:832 length:333 start_codon:yes stop_codon:yes gene_type:complete
MNIAKMMQQAKQMQAKMEEMQAKMMDVEVNGEAGAGLVKATVTGKGEVKSLKISPEAVSEDDLEMLEDLVIAAINDAKKKADDTVQEETKRMMEEMGLPAGMMGGGGLPF